MTMQTTVQSPSRYHFTAPVALLADASATWQQVLATGAWKHPSYGDMAITPADLRELKQNFDAGARQFVYADYDHGIARADGSGNAIAAGEVTQLELRNNDTELWALFEPTKPAREKIQAKEYRYTSADFDTRYHDKATGKLVGKVFKGFALTNTPYIEGMHPLTLGDAHDARVRGTTQLFAEFDAVQLTTETPMKTIAEKLGLKPDASEPEIVAAVGVMQGQIQSARTLSDNATASTTAIATIRGVVNLAETATPAEIAASVKTLAEQNATLTRKDRERDADVLLDERLRTGHITPAQKPDFRLKLLSDTPAVVTATKEILAAMPKVVPIGEGKATEGEDANKDYDTLLDERVKKIKKENKDMKFGDALILAERELADEKAKAATSTGSK